MVIRCGFFLMTDVLVVSLFGQKHLLNALNVNVNVNLSATFPREFAHDICTRTNYSEDSQCQLPEENMRITFNSQRNSGT